VKENPAFRRYLSAHHYPDKPFQILASEVQQHVDCTACANCCRYSVVPVNKTEIENIARYLGVTPEAAASLFTIPDPDAPALRILLNSGEGCVFVHGNLCMIYKAAQAPAAIFLTLRSENTHSAAAHRRLPAGLLSVQSSSTRWKDTSASLATTGLRCS
jgi:hypothetical protein